MPRINANGHRIHSMHVSFQDVLDALHGGETTAPEQGDKYATKPAEPPQQQEFRQDYEMPHYAYEAEVTIGVRKFALEKALSVCGKGSGGVISESQVVSVARAFESFVREG